jgi:CubicO group peptidase (beta-lactamase class C family)
MRMLFGTAAATLLAATFSATPTSTPAPPPAALPGDDAIRALLAERVGAIGEGIGIVVAVVEPQRRRVISHGSRGQEDPRPLDGDTVFEIGSVTKVFTALLLADMASRGEVTLEDSVAKYLPAGTRLPHRKGRSITVADLATHTSGLPFMPDDATAGFDGGDYSEAQLYDFLARYELERDAGAERDYSNLGYWLLGEALASRGGASDAAAGSDFESLVRQRILLPLGMTSTAFTPAPELTARQAVGHDAGLQPARSVADMGVYSLMPAAGGLLSTANDLARLLAAGLGHEPSPLGPAFALSLGTRRPTSRPGIEQALGWVIEGAGDDPLVFHDGGTWGYSSAVAWDPGRRVGVVVLSSHVTSVADLARHLLRPSSPLEKPITTRRTEVAVDAAVLASYVGRYEAEGEGVFVVAMDDGFLTFAAPADWGLPALRLRPETERDFFATELPLRVTFQLDAGARVSGIVIFPPRGQKSVPATRVVARE